MAVWVSLTLECGRQVVRQEIKADYGVELENLLNPIKVPPAQQSPDLDQIVIVTSLDLYRVGAKRHSRDPWFATSGLSWGYSKVNFQTYVRKPGHFSAKS